MKIDIFCHILPSKYLAAVETKSTLNARALSFLRENLRHYAELSDLGQRFRTMDEYGDYVQVLTVASPPLEAIAGPKESAELARIANDELAELVAKYPDRFVAAAAYLPTGDMDAALKEAERAIRELGLKGVEIRSNVNGKPIDLPEFMPLYELMTQHDLPIWIHPRRDVSRPDYETESMSKYNLAALVGWSYDTTLAICRLVYGGVMEKYPTLKVITHHAGGMVSFLEQRLTYCTPQGTDSSRPDDWNYNIAQKHVARRPWIDYFRMIYADTAVYGSTPALMCAHAFFGTDHMVFATDMPYDQPGLRLVRDTINSIDRMDIPRADRAQMYADNAKKLLLLSL